jgi:DNA-binding transcriptional MocR family regulator
VETSVTDWHSHYARRAARMESAEVRDLLAAFARRDVTSFAGGIPEPSLFPTGEIAAAYAALLGDAKRAAAALQYSVPEGHPSLRAWLAEDMTRRGTPCAPHNVLITNGSQQALDTIAKLFISEGETVLVGAPTFLGAVQAFNAYEPRYDELPGPESNRTPESFRGPAGARPKFGYVMPEFENPTGRTLTRTERLRLLDFADALDIPLVEDSPYETLRYSGEPAPLLISLAAARAGGIDACRVLHCGTFSKSVVPGLRVGWIIGPRTVIERLILVKQAGDIQTSTINQMVLADVAPTLIAAQADKVRPVYRARRDAMLGALRAHMPQGVSWTEPEGGFFVWVTLPTRIDTTKLLARSMEEAKVAYVPGGAFHAQGGGRHCLRLSFSVTDEATTEQGIFRLAKVIRGALAAS